MANTQTAIVTIEFHVLPGITHCNILYVSNEPGNIVWGGGWKTKSFPKTKSAIDILRQDVEEYLMWNDGREEVENIPSPEDYNP